MKVSTKQVVQTVAPVAEPVSLAEIKAHLRETSGDFDTELNAKEVAARQWVEVYLQRVLIQRTYRADLWDFASVIELPYPDLRSVTSIQYYTPDSPQVLTALDASIFKIDPHENWLYLDWGATYPSVAVRHDAVQITYVAGYEPTTDSPQDHAGNVPDAIKRAILLQVADLHENLEIHSQLKLQELPTVMMLLSGYRKY